MENIHRPVMVDEVLESLDLKESSTYIDATLGDGGHTREILKETEGGVHIIAIDRDSEALERAKKRLTDYGDNIEYFNINFADIDEVTTTGVEGILFDLGVSTYQLMTSERGFSFEGEGPLDMRMGVNSKKIDELVNEASEDEISNILYEYGGERFSRRIAKAIVSCRPIGTTKELAEIIERCYPPGYRRIHPATRAFQAFRIWANDELDNLKVALKKMPDIINPGGISVVITYHSLERDIVRDRFHKLVDSGRFTWIYRNRKPTKGEVSKNRRSRSARLFAIKKRK